jgi:hypothetical protein
MGFKNMIGGALDRANDRVGKAAQLVNYCARNEQRIVQEISNGFGNYMVDSSEIFGSDTVGSELDKIISNLNRDSDGYYVDCRKYRIYVSGQTSLVIFVGYCGAGGSAIEDNSSYFPEVGEFNSNQSYSYQDDDDDNEEVAYTSQQLKKMEQAQKKEQKKREQEAKIETQLHAIDEMPMPAENEFATEMAKCNLNKKEIAKKNDPIYKAWEKREKLLVVFAQSNYPQHPAIAEYLEEQKKQEAADLEKKKQEEAKKEQQRAEAKKKKEEEKLKEQKLSKIKKIIWGTWGGLSLLFLILAEEWWAYILIILAVIAVAVVIFFVTEFFLDKLIR